MNVVRMNFSHGSYEVCSKIVKRLVTAILKPSQYHQSVIDNARAAEKKVNGRPLAIALDTVSIFIDFSTSCSRDADVVLERSRDPHRKHSGRCRHPNISRD